MNDTTLDAVARQPDNAQPTSADPGIPVYMSEVYDWAYVNPRLVERLDCNAVVRTLLFGNDRRLMRAFLERIRPGMRVWQVAHVYGDLVRKAAERVGSNGHFLLTDVTPIQVRHGEHKLDGLPWADVVRADAGNHRAAGRFDLVCSFFLLHEVPDNWKRAVVDNMLSQIDDDAEALFVDYHRPAWWQPIGWLLRGVNRMLEPFAFALWDHEISHFAAHADEFVWQKRTLFGGVYQIVSVRRKR